MVCDGTFATEKQLIVASVGLRKIVISLGRLVRVTIPNVSLGKVKLRTNSQQRVVTG